MCVCWVHMGLREWREWTFNGGVKDSPLYFVFFAVLGGEFIPLVALNGDWDVWFSFLLSVLIVGIACHLLLPEGGCTQQQKWLKQTPRESKMACRKSSVFQHESRIVIQQAKWAPLAFDIITYNPSLLFCCWFVYHHHTLNLCMLQLCSATGADIEPVSLEINCWSVVIVSPGQRL